MVTISCTDDGTRMIAMMSPAASQTITMLDCTRNVISKTTRQGRAFPGERRGRSCCVTDVRWLLDRPACILHDCTGVQGRRSGYESGGGTAYMSTQREVLEGQTGSHRAKRANFGRGVRGPSPGKLQKPTWQMVQSTLFLSYICEYY